ncbi:unnamed protein product [Plutella xylostella]|uniref:(diamondback moth) hypothetical protein n=1 Tax=Plutella xylostella TaxID=51655 RepID=A0A8S4FW02_PLUXY|nr:unnamed protein product [Plutella xylostella]
MEELTKMMKEIQEELVEQKVEFQQMERNITTNINNNINNKFERMEIKYAELEKTVTKQEERLDMIEKQLRKKNLVFFGVEETEKNYEDLESNLVKIINDKMKVSCSLSEVESARRIGKRGDKPRPIVLTLTTTGKKIQILKRKKSLDGSTYYLKEDFPPKILNIRKELQEELKKKREEGTNAVLRYDKIIILEGKNSTMAKRQNNNKRNLSESPIEKSGSFSKQIQAHKKNKTAWIPSFFQPKESDRTPSNTLPNNA